jgi:peptidoglycan hydrolase-like protein with peptidoglycan-binding domain
MKQSVRTLILGGASVLALGIGGVAPSFAADAGNPVNARSCLPAPSGLQTSDPCWAQQELRKDDIRWAQVELRNRGLYKGSLDGVLGSDTKRALRQFQSENALGRTATLDAQTWEALTGGAEVGLGASAPSDAEHTQSMANSPASNLGR